MFIQLLRRMLHLVSALVIRADRFLLARSRQVAMNEMALREQQETVIATTIRHNMDTHPDEQYYRSMYLAYLEPALIASACVKSGGSMLDLGCGQGRLTIPLARQALQWPQTKVIGVDLSPPAVEFAVRKAASEGLSGICSFVTGDVFAFLREQPAQSACAVICTEVFFIMPGYRDVLDEIARVLKPQGLLMLAVRSRYYNVLHTVRSRQWGALPVLLETTEGYPWGPPRWFSWHGSSDIARLLNEKGFDVRSMKGIGLCSGIEGDPLADIARPSLLSGEELKELMRAEMALASVIPDAGRYIFVEAVRTASF